MFKKLFRNKRKEEALKSISSLTESALKMSELTNYIILDTAQRYKESVEGKEVVENI